MTPRQIQNLFPSPDAIPAEAAVAPMSARRYLVGGSLEAWDGPMAEIASPVMTRSPHGLRPVIVGEAPRCTSREALRALEAATRAYDNGRGAWPTMAVRDRIAHLEAFAVAMKGMREQVVRLLMWEIGKSRRDSEKEFDRTVDYIRDTVESVKELDRRSSRFEIEQGILAQIRRAPLGVCLCMGPYNYPLNETYTLLIPALIMGNTVVMKPPKHGVLLHALLQEPMAACFPPGVVNTVFGDGSTVIGPILESGRVDVLAFIGSSRVADILKTQHPKPHRLRSILGLDAKNAAVVLPDADLDLAAAECVLGGLSYNGQRCTAIKIIFVHRDVADDFVRRLCASVERLPCGMPWDPGVEITPLPIPGKPRELGELVDEAVSAGAEVVNAGGGIMEGSFYTPAVVYPTRPDVRLAHVEQFGPVVPVVPFDDISLPVSWVQASNYGQQVSLFGSDPLTLAALIDPLVNQVCRVNLNCQCQRGPDVYPFTGRKDSAEGTLSVSDALRVFSIRTLVAAKRNELNHRLVDTIVRERRSHFLSTDFLF